jgi:hypothetical protein
MFVIVSPPPGMRRIMPGPSGLDGLIEATSNVSWANPGHMNKRARVAERIIVLI